MDATTVIQYMTYGIIALVPICIIIGIGMSGYGIKRWMYDFLKVDYKILERKHEGKIVETLIVKTKNIKNNTYIDKNKNIYKLGEIFKPTSLSHYATRYTFNNDNIFPEINADGMTVTLTGINPKEVLTKTKDNLYFMISNHWIKNMLEVFFVDKIKKEKQTGLEAILDFLKSPAGVLLILGCIIIFGGMMYGNLMHK
jgi:hypothetical protein